MPKLGVTQNTRLPLPSSTDDDPAWIDVKTNIMLGDITSIDGITNDTERAITLLSHLITAWNFTDENGEPLEPNADNIKKLGVADFTHVSDFVSSRVESATAGLDNSEKKTLSSPSTTAAPTVSPPII